MKDERGNEAYLARAEARIRRALARLEELVPGKARAYGEAHALQRPLMEALLEQYRDGPAHYRIPEALLDHLPRFTRLFDRMARLAAHPATDDGRENPWDDMAGDCVAAMTLSDRPEGGGGRVMHAGGVFDRPGVPAFDADGTAQGRASHDVDPGPPAAAAEGEEVAGPLCGMEIQTGGGRLAVVKSLCVLMAHHHGPCRDQRGLAARAEGGAEKCGADFHSLAGTLTCQLRKGHSGPCSDGRGMEGERI